MSVSEIFEIPKYHYFDCGNDFSGSKDNFAYRIFYGDRFRIVTWHGRLCSDKAEIDHEAEFERNEEGFGEMIKWLEETYKQDP